MKKFLSILLAVMMVLSTVSFAVPSAVGTMEYATEAPVVPEAEVADLAAESADESAYGTLIFNLDFEDSTYPSGGSISNVGPVNSYVSADNEIVLPEEFGSAYFRIGMPQAYSGSYNTTMNGTNVLPVVASNNYPYFTLQAYSSSSDWTGNAVVLPTGYYTVVGDFAKDANNSGKGSVKSRIGNNGGQASGNEQNITTTMATYTHQLILEESTTEGSYQFRSPDSNATVYGPHAAISAIGTYFGSSTAGDIYYVDNYKMYWKPLTAKVTLTSGAEYLTLPESFEVSTAGVAVSELVANVKKAAVYYDITGVKVNGTEYALTDTVVITKDCEVEVLSEENTEYTSEWLDKRYGVLLFKSDFDSAETGSIDIMGDDNARLAAFEATSEMNPYFSEYSSMSGSMLLGSASITSAEIVADSALGSNVLKITASSASYPQINYITPYNQRAKCDIVNSTTGVYTIVHKYKTTTGKDPTYRYNGFKNDGQMTGNGGDDSQDAQTSTDLGNGYTEWVATYNMVEDYCIDTFKLHVNSGSATGDTYFDDIKVYWKPASVDVEIADCDVKGVTVAKKSLTGVATSGTVSDFLTLAGVDYSAVSSLSYVFRGVSVASNPSEVYGLSDTLYLFEDSTINLVFEKVDMSGWTDKNGIVLFDIDFEDAKAATVFTATTSNKNFNLTSFGAKVNPYISGSENWVLSNSNMNIVGIEDGALKLQWNGTTQYPQILIGNSSNTEGNELVGENGTYSVYVEYKALKPLDSTLTNVSLTANGFIDGTHKGASGILYMGSATPAADQWFTIEGSNSTWNNDTDGLDNDDINKITTVFNHSATTGEAGGYFLADNIKLWWKPSKVDVTIEGGVNEAFEAVTLEDVSTSATIDEIIAMLPETVTEYGKLTGLADENGVKLTSFSAVSDVTLQPLWSPWVIIDGGQEFPVDAKGISGGGSGQWSSSYGNTNEVGNGGSGNVTAAISWMYSDGTYTKDGNLYRVQDTVAIGENNASLGTATWSTPAVHSINDMIRDNIVTSLAADNDAEYVLTKYRYTNLPDLAAVYENDPNPEGYTYTLSDNGEELTYYDRTGATQTFDMSPAYGAKYFIQCPDNTFQYGGGQEYRQDELMVEGEWMYDFLPFTASMNTKGVSKVIIQRYNLFDQQVTEYDYVRFVKLGEESAPIVPEVPEEPSEVAAPESSQETSYRLNAPNGIRFKASMNGATNEAASDYGWVVGRAAKGATDETLVIDAANTITAYGREDGVDLKKFFEETDDLKTFTAVIYNLPVGYEDDTLCIKPFVIVDGEVYYGEMISKTPRQVAEAHGVDVSVLMKK